MGQLAETEVYRAGESTARGNLQKGEDNFVTFRGKSVFETRPYTLDVDGRRIDPLNRTRCNSGVYDHQIHLSIW